MEEKVKIELNPIEMVECELNGIKVKVQKNISAEQYETILKDIKNVVFYDNEIEDKVSAFDIRFIRDVLDFCTNIDISTMTLDDFISIDIIDFLWINIGNYTYLLENVQKEYDKFVMENCFGVLAKKMPSAKDMQITFDKLGDTINNMDSDKLEMIAKSITWNQMPTLGQKIAPAIHEVKKGE